MLCWWIMVNAKASLIVALCLDPEARCLGALFGVAVFYFFIFSLLLLQGGFASQDDWHHWSRVRIPSGFIMQV